LQAQSPASPTGESYRINYRLKIQAIEPMRLVRRPYQDFYVFSWRLFWTVERSVRFTGFDFPHR
jgi:hypothetical protein